MAPDPYSSNDPYTDQQRTRIIRRDDQAEHEPQVPSIGGTQTFSKQKRGGLLDDLSLAQVIAGAAAAATSVALASKIGLAGSVIGAAVSSVVTVISSQLYRRFLTASAQKIKNGLDTNLPVGGSGTGGQNDGTSATTVFRGVPARDYPGSATGPANVAQSGTRIAPKRLQARAEAERAATQRKVIGFSIAAAIVALIASVGIILALTAGEGLGTKTAPIFPASHSDEAVSTDDGTAGDSASTSDSAQSENTSAVGDASNSSDADGNASGENSTSGATGGSGTNAGDTSTSSGANGTGGTEQSGGAGNTAGTGGTSTDNTGSDSTSESGASGTNTDTSTDGTQNSSKPGASGSVSGDTGVLEQAAQ